MNTIEVESDNLDTFVKEEFIDLEMYSIYTFKGIAYYWMNGKKVTKYPKICATVEPIL